MHAVFDTESLSRQRTISAREKHEQQVRDWIREQQNNVVVINDFDLSPANAERQVGQAMFANKMEERLKRLNANLLFEVNPFNSGKKALYHIQSGQKIFICAYENGVMPEHSIMSVKEQEDIHTDFVGAKRHINRKDLPGYKISDGDVTWEGGVTPGFHKRQVIWHEAIRGWRTVLIKLVQHKLASPAQVEALFGIDGRPEWASKMGKRTDVQTIL